MCYLGCAIPSLGYGDAKADREMLKKGRQKGGEGVLLHTDAGNASSSSLSAKKNIAAQDGSGDGIRLH